MGLLRTDGRRRRCNGPSTLTPVLLLLDINTSGVRGLAPGSIGASARSQILQTAPSRHPHPDHLMRRSRAIETISSLFKDQTRQVNTRSRGPLLSMLRMCPVSRQMDLTSQPPALSGSDTGCVGQRAVNLGTARRRQRRAETHEYQRFQILAHGAAAARHPFSAPPGRSGNALPLIFLKFAIKLQ